MNDKLKFKTKIVIFKKNDYIYETEWKSCMHLDTEDDFESGCQSVNFQHFFIQVQSNLSNTDTEGTE